MEGFKYTQIIRPGYNSLKAFIKWEGPPCAPGHNYPDFGAHLVFFSNPVKVKLYPDNG